MKKSSQTAALRVLGLHLCLLATKQHKVRRETVLSAVGPLIHESVTFGVPVNVEDGLICQQPLPFGGDSEISKAEPKIQEGQETLAEFVDGRDKLSCDNSPYA